MNLRPLALTLLLGLSPLVHAELADKDKPINLEADRATIDDANKVQTLEGNVILIKGTLVIHADKIVVTEDEFGFQKSVAYGSGKSLAKFRQKREGLNSYMEGEGERIEHDSRSEIVEFFRRAWVRSSDDQVKGDYIWYDSIAEKYMVTAGKKAPGASAPPRVRAVIQPKNNPSPTQEPQTRGPTVQLRSSGSITPPTHPLR